MEIAECGNEKLEDKEECDDGNLENGDGCDDNCLEETLSGGAIAGITLGGLVFGGAMGYGLFRLLGKGKAQGVNPVQDFSESGKEL